MSEPEKPPGPHQETEVGATPDDREANVSLDTGGEYIDDPYVPAQVEASLVAPSSPPTGGADPNTSATTRHDYTLDPIDEEEAGAPFRLSPSPDFDNPHYGALVDDDDFELGEPAAAWLAAAAPEEPALAAPAPIAGVAVPVPPPPVAAAMALPADFAQQLGDAIGAAVRGAGGNRKVPSLKSTTADAWVIWRKQFEMICRIQGWNDQRQRRELFAAMADDAAKAVQDIDIFPDEVAAAQNIAATLDLYEARFVIAADTELARVRFQEASQKEDESLLSWHSRLRDLYGLGWPGVGENDPNTGKILRDRFAMGIRDDETKAFVWENAETYAECLERAHKKEASQLMVKAAKRPPQEKVPHPNEPKISQIGEEADPYFAALDEEGNISRIFPGGCWLCQAPDHTRRECRIVQIMDRYLARQRNPRLHQEWRNHVDQVIMAVPGAGAGMGAGARPAGVAGPGNRPAFRGGNPNFRGDARNRGGGGGGPHRPAGNRINQLDLIAQIGNILLDNLREGGDDGATDVAAGLVQQLQAGNEGGKNSSDPLTEEGNE